MPAFPSPLIPDPGPAQPAPDPVVPPPDWPGPGPAPNVARIYDALIGKDNYAADRLAARQLEAAVPGAARAARDNRAFLGRAVRFLAASAGIRQFIDIGAGLPGCGHGLDLVPPGLTDVAAWRPRRRVTAARPVLFRAGTGRTPGTTP